MTVSAAFFAMILPGCRIARERDEADVRVAHQRVTDGNPVARHDLQHARRDDLLRELREAKHREGRLLRRLDDLDVAGRERRPDLPHRHEERVVPGTDARDDPERLAPDHRRVALGVLGRGLALEIARGTGEEAQVVGHDARLVDCHPPRLADVERLEPRELLGVLVDDVGELRAEAPCGPSASSSASRPTPSSAAATACCHVIGSSARYLGDHLTCRRVQHLHRLARRRVHELAADELLLLRYRNAHSTSDPGIFRGSVSPT